ncbi:MAG TPA: MFS transporter [Roseiflexaceae bacterium]|nr:MFS transporter [Roseiflexaceae bacterium]
MTFESYRQIFQNRSFRRFWLGFSFSVLGDSMTRVALTWFVYEATKSAEALGWLMICYTAPIVVGGLLAGPLLDRFDRRVVMIVDNIVRGLAVALAPLLFAFGALQVWHVYAVAAVYGLLMMISLAGGPALVPSLVPREQLATANALEMLSWTLGGVIGPALAGVLIVWVGAPNVVILDAVSYFVFALALARTRLADEPRAEREAGEQVYHLGHAVQLLLNNRVLLSTTLMFMAFNIGGGALSVWLPIMCDQALGGGPQLYGVLLGALALGEVISALLAGGVALPLSLGALICLAQALSGASLGLVLVGRNAWMVGFGLALFGAFSSPLTIWAQTLRMQIIPERLRGRSFALLRMLMQSGNPIGGALAGLLLPVLGLGATISLSAIVVGVPGLIGYRVKELRLAGEREAVPVELAHDVEYDSVPEGERL